eukprot:scaffold5748_cov124-Isochrysis_galbana.AAC.5
MRPLEYTCRPTPRCHRSRVPRLEAYSKQWIDASLATCPPVVNSPTVIICTSNLGVAFAVTKLGQVRLPLDYLARLWLCGMSEDTQHTASCGRHYVATSGPAALSPLQCHG